MGGIRPNPADLLLSRQRREADRLRRVVAAEDGSRGRRYFNAFLSELSTYRRTIDRADLLERLAAADVLYVGDYHAVPECQRRAAGLLRDLASRGRRLTLGIEFVYTRQQSLLDRRQSGALDDSEFLRRIHYDAEWGFAWGGFRELLNTARELGLPVRALDVPPRRGAADLRRRDEHAARRIAAAVVDGEPMLVFFGESHLASRHLPRRTRVHLERSGVPRRQVRLFQNPDPLYWLALSRGEAPPRALEVDDDTFALLHTSPIEKYDGYRQVLERWRRAEPGEGEGDLTPAVHHVLEVLARGLGIRPGRRRLRHRAGWSEELIDAYPEVYAGGEARRFLEPILAEHGRTPEEVREATALLDLRGALYESRSNTVFLQRYRPGAAAGEAARFLRAALTGRLFLADEDFAGQAADAAYGAAYTEALAFLGSRLVDPTSRYLDESFPVTPGDQERWLADHVVFERSGAERPPAPLLRLLQDSRPHRRHLARDVGRRLGAALLERVRRGELATQELRGLFTRPLRPGGAGRTVVGLLRDSCSRQPDRLR